MNHPPLKYHHVIGIMSGTSLDGLDMAYCVFGEGGKAIKAVKVFKDLNGLNGKEEGENQNSTSGNSCWEYEVRKAITVPYPEALSQKLVQAMCLSGYELALLHNELGRFIGMQVNEFMADFAEEVELIASHGHTVFHRPDIGMTLQIGSGADIAAICGKPTICNFRTLDVALGGQGAPLVPIGDELLFGQYDICLNLGGISNLSYRADGQRKAYDISPCNIVLNQLARQMGKEYDADGIIAKNGRIDMPLLEQLNQLEYYQQLGTKSLGREWIDDQFFPILKQCQLSIPDQMRTVCEHIAEQIANACNSAGIKSHDCKSDTGIPEAKICSTAEGKSYDTTMCEAEVGNTTKGKTLLISGGGAHNSFLIELIREKFHGQVIIPDDKTIDFKEAIIFAFLGFLRANGLPNCLASVTGAKCDSSGGGMYGVDS